MPSIEELQAQLAEKIAKLDEERQENAKKFNKERETAQLELEMERKQRLADYEEKLAKLAEKKAKDAKAEEERRVREIAERVSTEQKQQALDEALRVQRERLEWLESAISNAEFAEEQHRKALENQTFSIHARGEEVSTINVENPTAPDNQGEAVEGTDGNTPETPLISQHLKHILRQANRQ